MPETDKDIFKYWDYETRIYRVRFTIKHLKPRWFTLLLRQYCRISHFLAKKWPKLTNKILLSFATLKFGSSTSNYPSKPKTKEIFSLTASGSDLVCYWFRHFCSFLNCLICKRRFIYIKQFENLENEEISNI